MSSVDLSDATIQVAAAEAARRGVSVDVVIEDAVRRYVAGADVRRLLSEWDVADADAGRLTDEEAMAIAIEEIDAHRLQQRRSS